ncbi:HzNVorf94-like-2 protein [Microplitis demolitor]|nr:HzNVorf94-like-2 protein [Microplitis demolitor]
MIIYDTIEKLQEKLTVTVIKTPHYWLMFNPKDKNELNLVLCNEGDEDRKNIKHTYYIELSDGDDSVILSSLQKELDNLNLDRKVNIRVVDVDCYHKLSTKLTCVLKTIAQHEFIDKITYSLI